MSRFVRSCVLFAVLQGVLFSVFVGYGYDPDYEFPLYASTRVKHHRLSHAPSPRMILVGGSNLFFGIESERIAERTDFKPVNMGLVGGLGLPFMLNEVEPDLRASDLVVLALEYYRFFDQYAPELAQLLMRVAERRPANLHYFDRHHWHALLDRGLHEHLGIVAHRAWRGLRAPKPRPRGIFRTGPLYNEYGDLVLWRHQRHPGGGRRANTVPRVDPTLAKENIERINRFADACRENGAVVVFTYPPVVESHFARHRDNAEDLHRRLTQSMNVPMINTQESMVFASEGTIDDTYHLQGDAIRDRTDRLIDAVLAYLSSEEAIELRQQLPHSTRQTMEKDR